MHSQPQSPPTTPRKVAQRRNTTLLLLILALLCTAQDCVVAVPDPDYTPRPTEERFSLPPPLPPRPECFQPDFMDPSGCADPMPLEQQPAIPPDEPPREEFEPQPDLAEPPAFDAPPAPLLTA